MCILGNCKHLAGSVSHSKGQKLELNTACPQPPLPPPLLEIEASVPPALGLLGHIGREMPPLPPTSWEMPGPQVYRHASQPFPVPSEHLCLGLAPYIQGGTR